MSTTTLAASRAALVELADLGEAQGVWKRVGGRKDQGADTYAWIEVETPYGGRFSLRGGGWNLEGRVSITQVGVEGPHGLKVAHSDLYWKGTRPEAAASHNRGAAVILKDFKRRVIDTDGAKELAGLLLQRLADMKASSEALAGHVKALQAMGYEFRRYHPGETYQADGYRFREDVGPREIKVYATGDVSFSARADLDTFAKVRQQLTSN